MTDPAARRPGTVPRPLLVVGDAFADLSARVPRFPDEGTDAQVGRVRWSSGGSATNVAVTVAALGGEVRLLTRVGDDPAAEVALRAARQAGVDLSLVQRDPVEPTGLCFVVVSPGGERTFFSARGANANLAMPGDAVGLLDGLGGLHLSGYGLLEGSHRETALALVESAARRGLASSLDLCLPLVEAHRDELLGLLPRIGVVFGNEREACALAGAPAASAAEGLVARGAPVVVVKGGGAGCRIASSGGALDVPGVAVAAVDTTGCGDAFVAGFLHALSRGAAFPLCGALGNVLGALAATRPGSGDALPGREAIRSFLSEAAPALLPLLSPGPTTAT